MELFIGKKFKIISKGKYLYAEIIAIEKDCVVVLINSKKITLDKKTLINKFADYYKREKISKAQKRCENCMEYKNGNCFGSSVICDDFRYTPEISKEEKDRWPKDGSVSRSKSNTFFIREYDDMYNKYH